MQILMIAQVVKIFFLDGYFSNTIFSKWLEWRFDAENIQWN